MKITIEASPQEFADFVNNLRIEKSIYGLSGVYRPTTNDSTPRTQGDPYNAKFYEGQPTKIPQPAHGPVGVI